MRRSFVVLFKAFCLFLIASTILFGISQYTGLAVFRKQGTSILPFPAGDKYPSYVTTSPQKEGNSTLLSMAPPYISAIMNANDTSFPRLECPSSNLKRYDNLRANKDSKSLPKYFFALDLHQSAKILPRLLGSIIEAMRFLGPTQCALSIVEGRSNDGTFEILKSLRAEIMNIGAQYFFQSSDLAPGAPGQDRIASLAELRNRALSPLTQNPSDYSPSTTIIFLNDVSLCAEDVLELIHQRIYQNADMTCAMDWTYVGHDPTFYDVWIARGMNGDTFFDIPEDGNWNSAWNLFWNNPKAKEGLDAHKPFQVFSCWNGAAAFTAMPFLKHEIAFRGRKKEECYQGEPKLFCKDMWYHGYRKIAVVPAVNIEYSDEAAKKIKALKGYTSQWLSDNEQKIEWEKEPPKEVKCMPTYSEQSWRAWG